MKNIRRFTIAIAVILVMTLFASTGLAESKEYIRNVWDKFDVEFTMPEEYYMWDESLEDDIAVNYGIELIAPSEETISISVSIINDDSMTDKPDMDDLSDSELELLEQTYEHQEEVGYFATTEGQLFMTVNWHENEQEVISYLTICNSCMIELLAEKTCLSSSPDFTEEEHNFLDDFVRSIRFKESYLTLDNGWVINKELTEIWHPGSADLTIGSLAEKENREYILICIIAENPETGDVLYLVKDVEKGSLRLVEKKSLENKKIMSSEDINL